MNVSLMLMAWSKLGHMWVLIGSHWKVGHVFSSWGGMLEFHSCTSADFFLLVFVDLCAHLTVWLCVPAEWRCRSFNVWCSMGHICSLLDLSLHLGALLGDGSLIGQSTLTPFRSIVCLSEFFRSQTERRGEISSYSKHIGGNGGIIL